ncbi:hypothetical protein [Halobacterium sp. KA-6]|uniref:hypothetical protein n=1 Tax=Halobacterium sp. KA-6 TaxID=2896368 RepID=UPI001E470AE2|nr:hypothetical protein [Halobacterium sp. KA-6]MCD2203860.1 hypothetical protein [Halobacterium sp. KA-6]
MPGIGQTVKNAIYDVIGGLVEPVRGFVKWLFSLAADYLTSTPYPDNLYSFGSPTKDPWATLFQNIYNDTVILLLPTLFGLALGLAMFFNIFTPKQKQTSIRRAVFAYPLAYSWWWFGGWFLKFNNDLADVILGGAADQFASAITGSATSAAGTGIVALLIYIAGSSVLLVVIAVFLLRRVGIYAYMVAMPILLMFWIVPIKPVEGWAKSMMGKFIPLVLMTLPTALLLRIGALLLQGNGGAAATGTGGIGAGMTSTVLGFATIAGAALVPKYVFSFSSQVSRAVQTGSRAGRGASRGVRASGASAAAASGGGAPQASDTRSGGSRSGGTSSGPSEEHKHDPKTDFSSSRRMRSQRRRRQQRAERVGSGARKAGRKAVDGTARASKSVLRNKRADGSTARGVAGDAKNAAKGGMSGYRQRINERMAVRSEQVKEKFTPGDNSGGNAPTQTSIDDYDDGRGEPPGFEDPSQTGLEEYEDSAGNEGSGTTTDAGPDVEDESAGGRDTEINSSPREFGSPSTNRTPDETEQIDETGSFSQSTNRQESDD